jgi:hypothetical protein
MKSSRVNYRPKKTIEDFKQIQRNTSYFSIRRHSACKHWVCFRTADAFLIEKIVLCGITAIPPNKEIHKTAWLL